jgi:hypothetical protein
MNGPTNNVFPTEIGVLLKRGQGAIAKIHISPILIILGNLKWLKNYQGIARNSDAIQNVHRIFYIFETFPNMSFARLAHFIWQFSSTYITKAHQNSVPKIAS